MAWLPVQRAGLGGDDVTTTDPLSLGEVKRLAAGADTVLLSATRSADLETPVGAFLRLDDGGLRVVYAGAKRIVDEIDHGAGQLARVSADSAARTIAPSPCTAIASAGATAAQPTEHGALVAAARLDQRGVRGRIAAGAAQNESHDCEHRAR